MAFETLHVEYVIYSNIHICDSVQKYTKNVGVYQ
jgi:hypothetical protein